MKSRITFHSGIHTIGGVVMELEYGNDRIIMEIGSAYNPETAVYDNIVQHRAKNWLKDALRLREAPAVAGIYGKNDLLDYPLESAEQSKRNTAVFVTHLHLDHMSAMGMVSPLVPVYLTSSAQTIEAALKDIGEGVIGNRKSYSPMEHRETIHIGEIEVTPFIINKRSYQDLSFYVRTPDLKLHYTGDVFLHGDYLEGIKEETEFLKTEKPDVLVCETTTFMESTLKMAYGNENAEIIPDFNLPEGTMNKEMLDDSFLYDVQNCSGLCIVNYYKREMSDYESFARIAKETNRILVLEADTAYLVYKFFDFCPPVYLPDNKRYHSDSGWLTEINRKCRVITAEEIKNNPHEYILQNCYPNILELLDLPASNGIYLHCGGEPLGDYDPAYHNMMRVLKLSGFKYIGTAEKKYFSHAFPGQVKYYVDEIDAKVLIPTHGYYPEKLQASKNGIQFIPEVNKTYEVSADKKTLQEVIKEKL